MTDDAHRAALRRLRLRAGAAPVATVLAGSMSATLPVVPAVPLIPPIGLLMLLGWRLLRPELWPAWIGLPLGLADDLMSGRPLGTAAVSWTVALLLIDASEDRMAWRSRVEEWLIAALACAGTTLWAWAVAQVTGSSSPLRVTAPALLAAVLLFPLAQRACAAADRWRLRA